MNITRIIFLCVCAFFVVLFSRFGFWQLQRYQQRQAHNAELRTQLQQPVREFSFTQEWQNYMPVSVRGQFLPEKAMLWGSRANNDAPGTHLVVPFLVTGTQQAILVDAGWFGFSDNPTQPEKLLESGEITLEGILLVGKSNSGWFAMPTPAAGIALDEYRWRVIDLPQMRAYSGLDLWSEYYLERTSPPLPAGLILQSNVELGDGNHIAYAIQWFSFALISLVGAILYTRRR